MNTRQIGDMGEKAVAEALAKLGYVVEIHPRTFKLIHLGPKKVIQVSQDNDYHTCFDVKAEGPSSMLYVQVKLNSEKKSNHIAEARHKIDKAYPYSFFYQRIQVWEAERIWVSQPHRHKEFRFRVWERKKAGVWTELGYLKEVQSDAKI